MSRTKAEAVEMVKEGEGRGGSAGRAGFGKERLEHLPSKVEVVELATLDRRLEDGQQWTNVRGGGGGGGGGVGGGGSKEEVEETKDEDGDEKDEDGDEEEEDEEERPCLPVVVFKVAHRVRSLDDHSTLYLLQPLHHNLVVLLAELVGVFQARG
eukprot:747566-Hanusia_phi.AAC.3